MKDINREEFQVGDSLKVIKHAQSGVEVQVGDVVECVGDDGSDICKFQRVDDIYSFYYYNDHLQKL